jgi:hypothetical protein
LPRRPSADASRVPLRPRIWNESPALISPCTSSAFSVRPEMTSTGPKTTRHCYLPSGHVNSG